MPQLIRLVARRLPADRDAVRMALCNVRRKKWRARLNAIVSRSGRPWIQPTDVQAAAAAIDDPEVSTETLEATLDRVVADRLRQIGITPEAALDSITADIADATPQAGHLASAERAQPQQLERAEKIYKHLVAWRWMSQRFPDIYRDHDAAEAERLRLNAWVEAVLSQQRRGRAALAA